MRYAIIDIGSNTVKISIYDDEDGVLKHIISQSNILGLATYRKDNVLTEDGIEALAKILSEYMRLANMISADHVACIATASLRGLDNAQEVCRKIRERCGFEIDIIPGEREAELGFAGLKAAVGQPEDGIFLDLGGASTELITIENGTPTFETSLSIGSLKLYHSYVKRLFPDPGETERIGRAVRNELNIKLNGQSFPAFSRAYLTGGTAKAIGKMMRMLLPKDDGRRVFAISEFRDLETMISDPEDEFLHWSAARIPERLHMIVPGLIALLEILDRFQISHIQIVYSGIRDGYVGEKFGLIL